MKTTNEQIEAIARECAEYCTETDYGGYAVRNAQDAKEEILTAANRIAALWVKESGAVKAMNGLQRDLICDCANHSKGDYHSIEQTCPVCARFESSLTALRAIIEQGTK